MFINKEAIEEITLSKVVIARVAILLLESEIKFSMSRLQVVTDNGWVWATLFRVRTAAKRSDAFGELKKSCRAVIAGPNSRLVTSFRPQIDRAAS